MTEHVYYRTALRIVAKGIVLKEHDVVESTGDEGMLIECVGAAPFEEQPYSDTEEWDPSGATTGISTERAHEILSGYLSDMDRDAINGGLHIVDPDDVVKRFTDPDETA